MCRHGCRLRGTHLWCGNAGSMTTAGQYYSSHRSGDKHSGHLGCISYSEGVQAIARFFLAGARSTFGFRVRNNNNLAQINRSKTVAVKVELERAEGNQFVRPRMSALFALNFSLLSPGLWSLSALSRLASDSVFTTCFPSHCFLSI